LLNELTRNLDAYRVSTYFYKDKDSKGGKLVMGPFWDYNLGFGNGDFFAAGYTAGWVADGLGRGDAYEIPFWWDRLRSDPYFENLLKFRWEELRNDEFSNESIHEYIDSCAYVIESAQQRNFQRFNILGTYVWPNFYVGDTYTSEVNFLKNWIDDRLAWMDSQIYSIIAVEEPVLTALNRLEVILFPNPFTESVTLRFNLSENAGVELTIHTILGQEVYTNSLEGTEGLNEVILEQGMFNEGLNLYIYTIKVDGELFHSGKLIKR
jgi:hypothetical protein